ncbi:MAG: hypothetical protein K2X55_17645 [Burkholderiaceae bacterium]|nr:hypothetical protein [Burkholderiaceae bacterium]
MIAPLDDADVTPLKSEKLAVSYQLIAKRINYLETLYRVLWLEAKTSSQDFSSIFPADQELTGHVVARLREQSFHSDSVYDLVGMNIIDAANQANARSTLQSVVFNHPSIPGTKILPAELFFSDAPKQPEFMVLSQTLRAQGYRYLMQLTAMDIYGNAIGYGMVVVAATPNIRIVDLQTNKVIWNKNITQSAHYQLGGDLMKLAESDMAKTREGLKEGIGKWNFSALLGLSLEPAP